MTAKASSFLIVAASLLMGLSAASAQVPQGSTGICKDGTYSTAAAKDGACRGHKGVQTWYSGATTKDPAAPAPVQPGTAPPASAASAAPAAPAAQPKAGLAAERAKLAAAPPAPGGGPGLVWLNGSSKVYHCPGSDFYGKTKTGAYLPEAEAKAKGGHADHNKPCT